MRALQRQVADVWFATTETDTSICRCHGMIAEAEVVSISTAFAVTAARVLDLEVFQKEHGDAYLRAKKSEHLGRVVDGMVLIRNAEVHLPVVLDPDSDRVLSLLDRNRGQLFRVIPKWKPYAALPAEIRDSTQTAPRCHDAYESTLQGASVVESLLDALAWFLACDPGLARRDEAGELEHFPLQELWQHDYERRHPEWKRRTEFEKELRDVASTRVPAGKFRTIRHRLLDDGRMLAFCGFGHAGSLACAFTEFPEQVVRDVVAGFPYFVETAKGARSTGDTNSLSIYNEALMFDGRPLADAALLPFDDEHPDEATWRSWFELARDDAFKYVEQRKAADPTGSDAA